MSLRMNDLRKEYAQKNPLSRQKMKQAFKHLWTDEQIESLLDSHAEGNGPFYLLSDLSGLTETRLQEASSDYEGLTQDMNNNRLRWYSAHFDVGTPPQRRHLMIDTGSSWMWTYAADCDTIQTSPGFFEGDQSEYCLENPHRFQT